MQRRVFLSLICALEACSKQALELAGQLGYMVVLHVLIFLHAHEVKAVHMSRVTKRGTRKGMRELGGCVGGTNSLADVTFEAVLPALYFGLMGVRPGQSMLGSLAKLCSFLESILLVLVCAC